MNPAISRFKRRLRPLKSATQALTGFMYDYVRFIRYSAWTLSNRDSAVRNYVIVKIYHRLEKSLSFRTRRSGSGWEAAHELEGVLKAAKPAQEVGFQDRVAVNVLKQFVSESDAKSDAAARTKAYADSLAAHPELGGGYEEVTLSQIHAGKLVSPEQFFFTRYSVRDFSGRPVRGEDITRAVELATKTPSVCSRQPWHVYHLTKREDIDRALRHQNGNRGFGHEVPALLIICADLRAFDSGYERYQHWIDGGMFAMSMAYALHSLGLGSCCLNWSRTPKQDKALRRDVAIADQHSVIMMMACGHANDEIRACASVRRPLQEIYTKL